MTEQADNRTAILVIAEQPAGGMSPVTLELAAFANALKAALATDAAIEIVAFGCDRPGAEALAAATGADVTIVRDPDDGDYNSGYRKVAICEIAGETRADFICAAHTPCGLDAAPALAARLGVSCVTGVTGIAGIEAGGARPVFVRSVYNGKFNCRVTPGTDRAVLAAQPGAFPADAANPGAAGAVREKTFSFEDPALRLEETIEKKSGSGSLSEAKVVIAGGRGIGEKENLAVVRRLAEMFPGAAVVGSRPLIDMGWMEYSRQVGLTGATVAPDLYIACGVSGSSQHIAGMKDSKFIVAINNDPNAAIFNIADVCIVADVVPFIEAFTGT